MMVGNLNTWRSHWCWCHSLKIDWEPCIRDLKCATSLQLAPPVCNFNLLHFKWQVFLKFLLLYFFRHYCTVQSQWKEYLRVFWPHGRSLSWLWQVWRQDRSSQYAARCDFSRRHHLLIWGRSGKRDICYCPTRGFSDTTLVWWKGWSNWRDCHQPAGQLQRCWCWSPSRCFSGKGMPEEGERHCWCLPTWGPRLPPLCDGNAGWPSPWSRHASEAVGLFLGKEQGLRWEGGNQPAVWEALPKSDARQCLDALFPLPGWWYSLGRSWWCGIIHNANLSWLLCSITLVINISTHTFDCSTVVLTKLSQTKLFFRT